MMTADEIMGQITRLAGEGLEKAAHFYQQRADEKLSVAAAYRSVTAGPRSRLPGRVYRVALEPATPDAAPRMVTGDLHRSGSVEKVSDTEYRVVYATPYSRRLELEMDHKWLEPTIDENLDAMGKIAGEPLEARVDAGGQ